MRLLALAFIALLTSTSANAQTDYNSGNFVLSGCESAIKQDVLNPVGTGYCMGVIRATAQFVNAMYSRRTKQDCIPADVQMVQKNRPELLHEDAVANVTEAISTAFNCNK